MGIRYLILSGLLLNLLFPNLDIDILRAIVSHLNESQYHSGNFHKPIASTDAGSSFGSYNNVVIPILSRKYISKGNDNDLIIS